MSDQIQVLNFNRTGDVIYSLSHEAPHMSSYFSMFLILAATMRSSSAWFYYLTLEVKKLFDIKLYQSLLIFCSLEEIIVSQEIIVPGLDEVIRKQ